MALWDHNLLFMYILHSLGTIKYWNTKNKRKSEFGILSFCLPEVNKNMVKIHLTQISITRRKKTKISSMVSEELDF